MITMEQCTECKKKVASYYYNYREQYAVCDECMSDQHIDLGHEQDWGSIVEEYS